MTEKKKQPFVYIVIPTIKRRDDIIKCLGFTRRLEYPKKRMEVIIRDNGVTDVIRTEADKIFTGIENEGWKRLKMIQSSI